MKRIYILPVFPTVYCENDTVKKHVEFFLKTHKRDMHHQLLKELKDLPADVVFLEDMRMHFGGGDRTSAEILATVITTASLLETTIAPEDIREDEHVGKPYQFVILPPEMADIYALPESLRKQFPFLEQTIAVQIFIQGDTTEIPKVYFNQGPLPSTGGLSTTLTMSGHTTAPGTPFGGQIKFRFNYAEFSRGLTKVLSKLNLLATVD